MKKSIFNEADQLKIAMGTAHWQNYAGFMYALGAVFVTVGFGAMLTFVTMFGSFIGSDETLAFVQWLVYGAFFLCIVGGFLMIWEGYTRPRKQMDEFLARVEFLEEWKKQNEKKDRDE